MQSRSRNIAVRQIERCTATERTQLDKLLGLDLNGIDLGGRDTVLVAEVQGEIKGALALRLIPLVHGFEIEPGMLQRHIAEALYQYASGYVRASQMKEVLILVAPENTAMQRFLNQHGGEVDVTAVYNMEVR